MKRTHLDLRTWTIAGLMLTVTAVGAAVVVAVAVYGGGPQFIASDPAAAELGVGRAGMAAAQDSHVAHMVTPEARGSPTVEHSVRSAIGLCPETDMQSDNLWEARATARCLRALDRSRGGGR